MFTTAKNSGNDGGNCDDSEPLPRPAVPVQPRRVKRPSRRDQRAYLWHTRGQAQRQIAARLRCSQPSVLRGIRRVIEYTRHRNVQIRVSMQRALQRREELIGKLEAQAAELERCLEAQRQVRS